MAELLVKAYDVTIDDPQRNLMAYKRGDIVVAMPDGHAWGSVERSTQHFLIIQVPDMSLAEARSLCEPIMGYDIVTGEEVATTRRRFFCAENIKPGYEDYFQQCVINSVPFVTNRLDLLSYSVTDKVG